MSNENIEIDDGSLVEPPQQYEDSIGFSNPEIAALFNASTPSTEEQEVPLTMVQEEADSNIATQPPVLSVEELTTLSEDEAKVSEESEAVLDKHEQDLKESYEESLQEVLTDEQKAQLAENEDIAPSEEQLAQLANAIIAKFSKKSGTHPDEAMLQLLDSIRNRETNQSEYQPLQANDNQQVTGGRQAESAQLGSAVKNALAGTLAAAASVSSLVATGVNAAAENGQKMLQSYLDTKKLKVNGPTQNFEVDSDPLIATTNMREEVLKDSINTYEVSANEFWQAPEMQNVKNKIKQMAIERGLSEQDIIAHINSGDPTFKDVSKDFNDAFEQSDKAQSAKKKMDVALDSWQQNHERLNKTALQLHASDHPRAKDTFDVLEDSEKQMLKNSAEVPKTENESQSNLEKIKENLQRLREAAKAMIEKLAALFGKGANNETSNDPSPS